MCVEMRRANKAIQREKLPIPMVDEILYEMNGRTVFSNLDMNVVFHQLSSSRGRGISQHFQLVIHCIVTRG